MNITMTEPSLEGADAWLNRSEEHLRQLKDLSNSLIESERDAVIKTASFDDTGTMFGYNATKPTAPNRISILVGEAIQAMRRSLDYLVYELASLDSGSDQERTQFPIEDSPEKFWARWKLKRDRGPTPFLIGVKREHAEAISLYQPYAGVDWTVELQTISNPDKHRRLTIARHDVRSKVSRFETSDGSAHQRVVPTPDGFDVFWTVDHNEHMKLHHTIYIAFDDGLGVVETLDEIKAQVANVLKEFRPCFDSKCRH